MAKDLRVTLLQTSIVWEDSIKNIKHINKQLSTLVRDSTDVIVLPEMFNTGFTMNAEKLAEEEGGLTMQWMSEVSSSLNAVVCGSIIIKEKNNFYNRFIWMNPDGSFQKYDKRHLFRMGGEDKIFTAGKENVVIECKGWMICPQVCYDLRFPVWSRNRIEQDGKNISFNYDILLYVASWPNVRKFAWQQLLIARAIENQSYVVGVNRIGKALNVLHNGDSVILDPLGQKISKTTTKSSMETITLSMENLTNFRKQFPVFYDADSFKIV